MIVCFSSLKFFYRLLDFAKSPRCGSELKKDRWAPQLWGCGVIDFISLLLYVALSAELKLGVQIELRQFSQVTIIALAVLEKIRGQSD
ncbi:hypothetical protein Taro_044574, partial [Colocasia esculenta]|nr:hypothetical protein [Colocasia esculenta]